MQKYSQTEKKARPSDRGFLINQDSGEFTSSPEQSRRISVPPLNLSNKTKSQGRERLSLVKRSSIVNEKIPLKITTHQTSTAGATPYQNRTPLASSPLSPNMSPLRQKALRNPESPFPTSPGLRDSQTLLWQQREKNWERWGASQGSQFTPGAHGSPEGVQGQLLGAGQANKPLMRRRTTALSNGSSGMASPTSALHRPRDSIGASSNQTGRNKLGPLKRQIPNDVYYQEPSKAAIMIDDMTFMLRQQKDYAKAHHGMERQPDAYEDYFQRLKQQARQRQYQKTQTSEGLQYRNSEVRRKQSVC